MLKTHPLSSNKQQQSWQKLGVVFHVDQQFDWMYSHASFPKACLLNDSIIRIFFTTRDVNNRGRIAYVDVAANNPLEVLAFSQQPVLDLGEPGTFDDAGVTPSSVLWHEDKIYLYYHGWNAMQLTPHRMATGLAISHDQGKTFQKYSRAPLFDRTDQEPIFSNNPCVLKDKDVWHMWYLNLEKWVPVNGKLEGLFTLYYAHAKDGISWHRNNQIAIQKNYDLECISNASVIKKDNTYRMWYSYRSVTDFREGSGAYLVGYAESVDAKNWERMDDLVLLSRGDNSFDSTMLSFPSVVEVNHKYYLFYNGNGFGKTGIGVACLD